MSAHPTFTVFMRGKAAQHIPMQRSFARDRVVCTSLPPPRNYTRRKLSKTFQCVNVSSLNLFQSWYECKLCLSLNGDMFSSTRMLRSLGSLVNYIYTKEGIEVQGKGVLKLEREWCISAINMATNKIAHDPTTKKYFQSCWCY